MAILLQLDRRSWGGGGGGGAIYLILRTFLALHSNTKGDRSVWVIAGYHVSCWYSPLSLLSTPLIPAESCPLVTPCPLYAYLAVSY